MEFGYVTIGSILGMIVSMVFAIGIPIALLLVGKIKFKAKLSSFFIGCSVFLVMALILEQILHFFVLSNTGTIITGNVWIYALYGALAAAVFEETGRFIAMKYFLKKNRNFQNAFMYGVGHGGFEAIIIVGLSSVANIVSSMMINNGMMEQSLSYADAATATTTFNSLQVLWTTPSYQFYMAGAERLFAIILQIGFSLIMYQALKAGKKYMVLAAFALHFVVDFIVVVLNSMVPIYVIEIVVGVLSISVMLLARYWNKNEKNTKEETSKSIELEME